MTDSKEIKLGGESAPHKRENDAVNISAGYAATQVADAAIKQAAKDFVKPENYTGNRTLYDSGKAKVNAKQKMFQNGQKVVDPYTGERLVLTKQEAKMLYGDDWAKHLAESDHIKPLEQIFNDTKRNVWNTTDDIKSAANSDDNISVVSRKFNNAKRSHKNSEFVENEENFKSKGIEFTKEGKERAVNDEEIAEISINKQLKAASVRNMIQTGHEAGKSAARNSAFTALTVSGIMNMVAVIKGEKTSEEAISATIKDGGKAAVTGYVIGGGLTVLSHSLSESFAPIIKQLAESNAPGKVIVAISTIKDVIRNWSEGNITTQECLIELGDRGLNMATMGGAMAIGQAMIPIPIVGGAIGALVGSVLTSYYYNTIINAFLTKKFEHQERERIIAEYNMAARQTKEFREELELYLNQYFQEYREFFDRTLMSIQFAYQNGGSEEVIERANMITRKLGGQVYYETVAQCGKFLESDKIDIL